MVYDVFRQLILNRFFLTEDFCKTHQISVSKLRRLISRINAFLKPYDCFIKIGKKVSIVGKESQIRLLFFMFLYFVHQKITRIEWIESEEYLVLSRRLCRAFYLTPEKENIEVLALWLFINNQSQLLKKELEEMFINAEYLMELPQNQFSKPVWAYLLIVMYSLDFIHFEPNLTFENLHQNNLEEPTNEWIELFEENVRDLNKKEKNELYLQVYKRLILENIVPLRDIYTIFKAPIQTKIQYDSPYVANLFEYLWKKFNLKYPQLATEVNRLYFLDAYFSFFPPNLLVTTVCCRWHSSLSLDRLHQMEKIIQYELIKVAKIVFVDSHELAEIVISTESSKEGILIDPTLSKKDILFLRDKIKKKIQEKTVGNAYTKPINECFSHFV